MKLRVLVEDRAIGAVCRSCANYRVFELDRIVRELQVVVWFPLLPFRLSAAWVIRLFPAFRVRRLVRRARDVRRPGYERRQAIQTLGDLRAPQAIPDLIGLLKATGQPVWLPIAAATALTKIGDPTGPKTLFALYRKLKLEQDLKAEFDSAPFREVLGPLLAYDAPGAVEAVIDCLTLALDRTTDPRHPKIDDWLCSQLAGRDDPRALPFLIRLAKKEQSQQTNSFVRAAERILAAHAGKVPADMLRQLTTLDGLQVFVYPAGHGDFQPDPYYEPVDCSRIRQQATAELKRRAAVGGPPPQPPHG